MFVGVAWYARVDRAALVDNIARQGDCLDEIISTGGLAVLDLIRFSLGRDEAELAADDNNVVGRGSAVLHWGQLQQ